MVLVFRWGTLRSRLLFITMFSLCIIYEAEAAAAKRGNDQGKQGRKGRRRKNTAQHRARLGQFWKVIKYAYIAVIAPVLIGFIFSLVRDPAVPQVVRAIWEALKRQFNSSLSTAAPGIPPPPVTRPKTR